MNSDSVVNKAKYTNALIDESSPYLLQHAHNPVDWFPWGEEALSKARNEDKPIFLSIGYAACHWCHVMEHESFENEEIAAILNEHFISIKVDREQRPDLDQIYMSATMAMTGSGGWPMSVFLTPELKPFFAGTYFPREDGYGRPGFKSLLTQLIQAYNNDRSKVEEIATQVSTALKQRTMVGAEKTDLNPGHIETAIANIKSAFDPVNGGFGNQPKFPHGADLTLVARYYASSGDKVLLNILNRSLTKMAHGGIYDQLGGGFHRYSVDARWLVPHFEKMLYDNGLLAVTYGEAYQITGNELYRRIVTETLDFILREMTDESGGFYSSLDADSEGHEGKFYVWTENGINNLLKDKASLFKKYFNISKAGNFEDGTNIPNIDRYSLEFRNNYESGTEAFDKELTAAKKILFDNRSGRIRPGTDDKILTSWNGLAISGFCKGYQITGDDKYRAAARNAAKFVKNNLYRDKRLIHSYREGRVSEGEFLEDYAYLIPALIDLYETTYDYSWIEFAHELAERAIDQFSDEAGNYFLAPANQDDHFMRPADIMDGAIPAPGSVFIQGLIRLWVVTGRQDLLKSAEKSLAALSGHVVQYPQGMVAAVTALNLLLSERIEVVVVGIESRDSFLEEIYKNYHPNRSLIISDNGTEDIPLLEGRESNGPTTAYVCRNFVCQLPARTVGELRAQLNP